LVGSWHDALIEYKNLLLVNVTV